MHSMQALGAIEWAWSVYWSNGIKACKPGFSFITFNFVYGSSYFGYCCLGYYVVTWLLGLLVFVKQFVGTTGFCASQGIGWEDSLQNDLECRVGH